MSILEKIESLDDVILKRDLNLKTYSYLKLESSGNLVEVKSLEGLKSLLNLLSKTQTNYRLIGNGSNFILPEKPDYLLVKLSFVEEERFTQVKNKFHLCANIKLNSLTAVARKFGLRGWEVFTGIPGNLGGAVAMNAGTGLGEISEIVEKVYYLNAQGEEKELQVDKSSFDYRQNNFLKKGEVIYAVDLVHHGLDEKVGKEIVEYLQKRSEAQPLKENNCGCTFKNAGKACRAGHFIDILGLKGLKFKDLQVSNVHANFINNLGTASKSDLEQLIQNLQDELKLYYGVKFEVELKFD